MQNLTWRWRLGPPPQTPQQSFFENFIFILFQQTVVAKNTGIHTDTRGCSNSSPSQFCDFVSVFVLPIIQLTLSSGQRVILRRKQAWLSVGVMYTA